MSRIRMITSATAALLMTASALAWSWEVGSRLTLVTSNGARIVGVGLVEDGRLTLTVESEFEGIAVLVVERADGRLETVDVVVEKDGRIMVGEEGEFSELGESLTTSGFDLAVGTVPATAAAGEEAGSKPGSAAAGVAAATGRGPDTGGAASGLNRAGSVADEAASGREVARERAAGSAGKKTGADVDVGGAGNDADGGLGVGAGRRVGNGRD